MKRTIRPTLVIGAGEQGARVAVHVANLAEARLHGLGVLKAMAVLDAASEARLSIPTTRISGLHDHGAGQSNESPLWVAIATMLEELYRVDTRQAAHARGWDVNYAEGTAIFLVAAYTDVAAWLQSLGDMVQRLDARHPARRVTLGGVLLFGSADGVPADVVALFTEGCYALMPVNVHGLSLGDRARWEDMIARWLVEMPTSPLGARVASLPVDDVLPGEACFSSFGLACWRFPAQELADFFTRRLQRMMLDALLAFASKEGGSESFIAALRERCGLPPLDIGTRSDAFSTGRARWARPTLARVATLKTEIDAAAETELASLDALVQSRDAPFEAALQETGDALRAECAASLDYAGLARLSAAQQALAAARRAFQETAQHAEQQRLGWQQAWDERHSACAALGQALDEAGAAFPPWTLRAWWGLLCRPWRWLAVVRAYGRVISQAKAYLACREALHLLVLRKYEAARQAAYSAGVAEQIADLGEHLQAFSTALRQARKSLEESTESATNSDKTVSRLLEAAALPAQLAEHFFTRSLGTLDGELAALHAHYGPLSAWALGENGAPALLDAVAEHAREHFDFLEAVRLDDLLVRTYSGAELRARLAELLEAAAPFWTWDQTALPAEERARLHPRAWIGLPRADDAPLVDLLPERGVEVYSRGDLDAVVAVQMVGGLKGE